MLDFENFYDETDDDDLIDAAEAAFDEYLAECTADYSISIHALAKRATANLYNDYLYFEAKYHISDIFPL